MPNHATSQPTVSSATTAADQAQEFLTSMNQYGGSYATVTTNGSSSEGSASKKRKLGGFGDEFPDFGGELDGIDEDVQEMLKHDGGGM